jgi:hypothetical protein
LSFWSHRSRSTYCIAINSHTVHAHRKVLVLVALLVLEHAQSDNDDNENDRSSRNRHRRWVRTFPRFSRRSSNNIIIIIIIIMSATSLVDNPLCVSWTLRRRKKFLIVPWHGMAWHGMLLFSCRLCKNVEGPADAGGMYWTKDFDFE